MAAYLSRKSRGCSAITRPAPLPTPTNAGPARRREKHAPLRKHPPHLLHSIKGDCRDDVRSGVDFTDKPSFGFIEQDKDSHSTERGWRPPVGWDVIPDRRSRRPDRISHKT